MSPLLWLFAVYFATLLHSSHAHVGCGTDHMEHKPASRNMKIKPIEQHTRLEGRAQDPDSSGVFSNIRIHVNTSQLQKDWAGFNKLSYYIDDVIPAAYEWIQNVFKVRPVDGPLTFDLCNEDRGTVWTSGPNRGKCKQPLSTWQQCGDTGALLPEYMFDAEEICANENGACDDTTHTQGDGLLDTDLVIYFTGDPSLDDHVRCDGVMGFATYCHANARGRPIAGMVNLCRNTIKKAQTWEEPIMTIIHETFHVLGFLSSAFDTFLNDDDTLRTDVYEVITKRGSNRAVITLPTVVEKARTFFDCDTMDGIELEDWSQSLGASLNGALASHWDLRILINDVMVSQPQGSPVYGMFTLALFADTGWYQMNWDYAQEGPFGKDGGCPWYNNKCINNAGDAMNDIFCTSYVDHTCNVGQIGIYRCTTDTYASKIEPSQQYFDNEFTGGSDPYADFCPIFKQLNNGDCRLWGANDNGTRPPYIDEIGGLISGASKCATVYGSGNDEKRICYPTHCIRNDAGEYVATRITHYRNYKMSTFDVITCWSDENNEAKDFPFDYAKDANYGFETIYCPVFEYLCYDANPWMCNGHGTIVDGVCVCSPGYFGRDCTIENTALNRAKYDETDSVSVYESVVCGGEEWSYEDAHDNVGVLDVECAEIDATVYDEEYFKGALKHLVAILTEIPACDVEIRDFEYDVLDDTRITAFVYYYTTLKAWDEVSDDEIESVFGKLFESVEYSNFNVSQHKEAEGDHDDNIDDAPALALHSRLVVILIMFVAYSFCD
eukprot:249094_1